MRKIATSAILAVILVLPISATSISSADAKMQPSGRPDVSLLISISYVNEERFQPFYDDIGKVDRIFETVILPVINDFVKKRANDINEKYTDEISMAYYRETNDVLIRFMQYPEGAGETIKISPESSVRLEVVDMFHVNIPVGMMFYTNGGDSSLNHLLPNSSVRVGYISNKMQELVEKYRDEIVGGSHRTISSFMLDDVSKTTIYLDGRLITEYDTDIDLALNNPVSAYSVPEFSTNTPILIVKSSKYSLTVYCASPGVDLMKMKLILTDPNGENVSISLTSPWERTIQFTLEADGAEGFYKLVVNDTEPKKIVYCHARVNVGNDHPFEYVEQPQSETISVHDVRLIDDSYNIITLPELHSNARVQMSLTNNSDFEHKYVYILLIKNSQGITDFISMVNGTLPARGGTINLNSELWCIKNPGVYSAEIYIWDDLTDPLPLSTPYLMRGIGMNLEGTGEEGC